MSSEPVPPLFQLYFYSAIALSVLVSLIVVAMYRRAVLRNMLIDRIATADVPTAVVHRPLSRTIGFGPTDYYVSMENRVKIRLASIYGAAIFGVVLLAVWIRFFTGNAFLIRGSTFFAMWVAFLGISAAFAMSAVLLASVGIPLLAVLLTWNWKRATVLFTVYVALWAVVALTLIVIRDGWFWAGRASTLIYSQLVWNAMIALVPFLLLFVTGSRRVRAALPITLAGSLVFCAVLVGAFFLTIEVYRRKLIPLQLLKSLGHSGILLILAGLIALFVSWYLLRALSKLYEKKVYSDRQLLVDCWSLVVVLYVFARLGETPGTPQLLIALGFVVFFGYRLLIHAALRLFVLHMQRPPSRRLLVLRTFGFQRRTERMFEAVCQRWRFHGSVLMIAGPDLAARNINPADYLRFLGGHLRKRFIRSEADLQRNLDLLDDQPDPDGRYRVNELFCCDDTWQPALVALLDRSDVVLMDLRGFGSTKRGCVFELRQLVERGPVGHVVLAVDDTTDRILLDSVIRDAWNDLLSEARRPGAVEPTFLPVMKQSPREMARLFGVLQGAKKASPSALSAIAP